jgi:hypothetical protein
MLDDMAGWYGIVLAMAVMVAAQAQPAALLCTYEHSMQHTQRQPITAELPATCRDETGAQDQPWADWTRRWTAEENRHGDLLNKYLYLSGRVDMRQIEVGGGTTCVASGQCHGAAAW